MVYTESALKILRRVILKIRIGFSCLRRVVEFGVCVFFVSVVVSGTNLTVNNEL